jgi:hypothetical protein
MTQIPLSGAKGVTAATSCVTGAGSKSGFRRPSQGSGQPRQPPSLSGWPDVLLVTQGEATANERSLVAAEAGNTTPGEAAAGMRLLVGIGG